MFFRKRSTVPPLSETSSAPKFSVASTPSTHSVIGRNTRFRGEVRGRGPLVIRGLVEGDVEIQERLTVDIGGLVDAEVRVQELVVAGEARGNVQVQGVLALRSTGSVEGTMSARSMRVEEGAFLKGTFARAESRS